jgi:hypothetical protein
MGARFPSPAVALPLQRHARHLHDLGPRAVHEALAEITAAHGIEDDVLRRLEAYRRLTRAQLAVTGGDRFPAPPLREVPR